MTATDFVGPAANVATRIMRFVNHSKQTGDPLAFLYTTAGGPLSTPRLARCGTVMANA
jgi:hypothetical protein